MCILPLQYIKKGIIINTEIKKLNRPTIFDLKKLKEELEKNNNNKKI